MILGKRFTSETGSEKNGQYRDDGLVPKTIKQLYELLSRPSRKEKQIKVKLK